MKRFPQRNVVLPILFMVLAASIGRGDDPATPVRTENLYVKATGSGLYRPNKWGIVGVGLRNSSDQDTELLVTTNFQEDSTLQFGRSIWLPAKSSVRTWHPIRLPSIPEKVDRSLFELRTQALRVVNGVETLATNDAGGFVTETSLMLGRNELSSAIFVSPQSFNSESTEWCDPANFIRTLRFDRKLKFNLATITDRPGPSGEEAFDSLDHIIIADDRLKSDIATVSAIRRWVVAGGRLWIMADCVSNDLIQLLLGDECAVTEVDRVDLTDVKIVSSLEMTSSLSFQKSEMERPVPFVRVTASNEFSVPFTVDGWPAALWKSYGDGKILVTTLNANGWVRRRELKDQIPGEDKTYQTDFIGGVPIIDIGFEFFVPKTVASMKRSSAEDYIQQFVGYSIPGRFLVLGTLFAFSIAIVGFGIRLSYQGRLERLLLVVPVLSIIASAVLLFSGWRSRTSVPLTVAVFQHVQTVPGTDDVRTSGIAGVVSSDSKTAHLHGERGGWMLPETSGLQGSLKRIVWSDIDQWSWEKLVSAPGLRMVEFQSEGVSDIPLHAVGRLAPSGINGKLNLNSVLTPTDAIIATSRGRLGVRIRNDGEFVCDPTPLAKSEYLASAVLSDEQQRRSRLMEELLRPQKGIEIPNSPTMYFWTYPWKVGMSLTRRLDMNGSALVSIPMHWQRPSKPGTAVDIPSPLLPYREVTGPDGQRPVGIYDYRTNRWVERTGRSGAWLGFQIPKSLLPLDVKSATMTFMVLGPMGKLKLSAFDGAKVTTIKEWDAPVGTLSIQITESESLKVDALGRLLFRIDIGASPDAKNGASDIGSPEKPRSMNDPASYWQFEDVSLNLKAEIPPVTSIPIHSHDHSE